MSTSSLSANTFMRAFSNDSVARSAGHYEFSTSLSTKLPWLLLVIYEGLVAGPKALYRLFNSADKVSDFIENAPWIAEELGKALSSRTSGSGRHPVEVTLHDGSILKLTQQFSELYDHETVVIGVEIELGGVKMAIDGSSFKVIYDRLLTDAEKNRELYGAYNFWKDKLANRLLAQTIDGFVPCIANTAPNGEHPGLGKLTQTPPLDEGQIRDCIAKLMDSGRLTQEQTQFLTCPRIVNLILNGTMPLELALKARGHLYTIFSDRDGILGTYFDRPDESPNKLTFEMALSINYERYTNLSRVTQYIEGGYISLEGALNLTKLQAKFLDSNVVYELITNNFMSFSRALEVTQDEYYHFQYATHYSDKLDPTQAVQLKRGTLNIEKLLGYGSWPEL